MLEGLLKENVEKKTLKKIYVNDKILLLFTAEIET